MEIREGAGSADDVRLAELWNRVLPRRALTPADLASYWASCSDQVRLLACDNGTVLGIASAARETLRPHPILRLVVAPEQRGRGAGRALYDAVAAWARERGYTSFETWIDDDQPEAIRFVLRRGFEQIGHDDALELDLPAAEPPAVSPPVGIRIVRWSDHPELDRGLYEVAVEAIVDIPGEDDVEVEPFEVWLEQHMRGPGDSPEATFVALAGSEVVGYSKFSLTEAQPTIAFHDLTGVKRAWRGRGIARALKAAQIAWAKEQGFERAVTRNEDRNEPIRRLNEQFGYRLGVGRGTYRGPVSAST